MTAMVASRGKGGSRLSFNALEPQEDYRWILQGGTYQVLTAEPGGKQVPRVILEEPKKSLLLLKPTLTVPHQGGKHFSVGSVEYETLLKWVRDRAPYGEEEGVKIERLDVFPKLAALDPSGKAAAFGDGTLQ